MQSPEAYRAEHLYSIDPNPNTVCKMHHEYLKVL